MPRPKSETIMKAPTQTLAILSLMGAVTLIAIFSIVKEWGAVFLCSFLGVGSIVTLCAKRNE